MGTPKQKSHLSKILVGTSQLFCGDLIGKLIVFLYTLIIVRLLSTAEAGIFFWLFALTEVLVFLSMLGLRSGVVKFISASGSAEFSAGIIRNALFMTVAMSIIIAGLLYLIVTLAFKENSDLIAAALPFFACALPFEAIRRILLGATESIKKMHYTAYIESLSVQFLRLAYFLLLYYGFKLSLSAAAMAYLATAISTSLVTFFVMQKNFKISLFKSYPNCTRELLSFSLPLAPASLLYDASRQLDIILLGVLGSPVMVTIFSVTARLCNFAEIFTKAVQQSFSPHLAELFIDSRNTDQIKSLFRFVVKWSYAGSFQLFAALIIFAAPVMAFFNVGTAEGIMCITIIAATHAITSLSNISSMAISMAGYPKIILWNNICYFIATVTLNIVLIPILGLLGAVIAHAASNLLLMAVRNYQLLKLTAINTYSVMELKVTIFGVIISIAYYNTVLRIFDIKSNIADIVIYGGIFILIYSLCTFILIASQDEKQKLKSFLN